MRVKRPDPPTLAFFFRKKEQGKPRKKQGFSLRGTPKILGKEKKMPPKASKIGKLKEQGNRNKKKGLDQGTDCSKNHPLGNVAELIAKSLMRMFQNDLASSCIRAMQAAMRKRVMPDHAMSARYGVLRPCSVSLRGHWLPLQPLRSFCGGSFKLFCMSV